MDYEEYWDQLQANWDDLMDLALDKISAEKDALWAVTANTPVAGAIYHIMNNDRLGQTDASRTSETLIDLELLAARFGDYTSTLDAMSAIDEAREILNGDDGVDGDIRVITEGLSTWESSTSETFKVEYVETIGQRKTNQYEALGNARTALDYSVQFTDEYRLAVLDLPVQAKKALEAYDLGSYIGLGTAAIAIQIVGLAAKPLAGLVLAEVEKKVTELQKREGTGVAGIFEELRKGIDELGKSHDASMEDLAGKVADQRDAENWSDFVCSRPSPDGALAEQSSATDGGSHSGGGI